MPNLGLLAAELSSNLNPHLSPQSSQREEDGIQKSYIHRQGLQSVIYQIYISSHTQEHVYRPAASVKVYIYIYIHTKQLSCALLPPPYHVMQSRVEQLHAVNRSPAIIILNLFPTSRSRITAPPTHRPTDRYPWARITIIHEQDALNTKLHTYVYMHSTRVKNSGLKLVMLSTCKQNQRNTLVFYMFVCIYVCMYRPG